MNPEVLQKSFEYATSNGYTGTQDEFLNLLKTNEKALSMTVDYAVNAGLVKDKFGFESAIGLKKKEQSLSVSPSAAPSRGSMQAQAPVEKQPNGDSDGAELTPERYDFLYKFYGDDRQFNKTAAMGQVSEEEFNVFDAERKRRKAEMPIAQYRVEEAKKEIQNKQHVDTKDLAVQVAIKEIEREKQIKLTEQFEKEAEEKRGFSLESNKEVKKALKVMGVPSVPEEKLSETVDLLSVFLPDISKTEVKNIISYSPDLLVRKETNAGFESDFGEIRHNLFKTLQEAQSGDQNAKDRLAEYVESGSIVKTYNELASKNGLNTVTSVEEVIKQGSSVLNYESSMRSMKQYLDSSYQEGIKYGKENGTVSEVLENAYLVASSNLAGFRSWLADLMKDRMKVSEEEKSALGGKTHGQYWFDEAEKLKKETLGLTHAQYSEVGLNVIDWNKSYAELQSEGKWEESATKAAIDIVNAVPQIVVDAAVYRLNPFAGKVYSGTSSFTQSLGSAYVDVREDQYMTFGEKTFYSTSVATVTTGIEMAPFFRGLEESAEKILREKSVDAAKKTFLKKISETPIAQGVEEAFISLATKPIEAAYKTISINREIDGYNQELTITTDEIRRQELQAQITDATVRKDMVKWVSANEIYDNFIVGTGAGSGPYALAKSFSAVGTFASAKERAAIRSKEAALFEELAKTTDETRKAEIKKDIATLAESHNRLAMKDAIVYESMTEEEIKKISVSNRTITAARQAAVQARALFSSGKISAEERDARIEKIKTIVETEFNSKKEIESKYIREASKYDNKALDEEEIRVVKEVSSLDADIESFGQLAEGQESIEVTAENAEQVINGIVSSGKIRSTKFSTAEQITKGLRNVVSTVKSLAKSSPGVKVIVHGTKESMQKASGQTSRGYWVNKNEQGQANEIHLYVPALKTNTAYHEAYHEAEFSQLKGGASQSLATAFASAQFDENTKEDLGSFVREQVRQLINKAEEANDNATVSKLQEALDSNDLGKMIKADDTGTVADEFLTELKATIETGEATLDFKTSLAGKLKEFVSRNIFRTGVGNPKARDVIAAINSATGRMAKGEELSLAAEKGILEKQTKGKRNETAAGKAQPIAGNRLFSEPLEDATRIAERYVKERGIEGYEKPEPIRKIDKERAKRISNEFDAMENSPNDPEVIEHYELMAEETLAQYDAIIAEGYVVEVNNSEPYSSSGDMIEDLRNNKRMKIFSTESGFGEEAITEEQRAEDPRLRRTKYTDVNGVPLLVNDVFRFVHDFFGHAKLGNGFGAVGEENAWRVHAAMFTPKARRAMTTETRGQNSWVNFSGINEEAFAIRDQARKLREEGKIEEANELVGKVYETMKFAEQKLGLLPEWVATEGAKGKAQLPAAMTPEGELKFNKGEIADISKVVSDMNDPLYGPLYSWWKANGFGRIRFSGLRTSEGAALYYPSTNTIAINTNRQEEFVNIDRNVAHEVIHGMLHKAELSNPELSDRVSKIREDLIAAVESGAAPEMSDAVAELYKFVVDGSHQELITYALTSPEFGRWLSSVAYTTSGRKPDSMWQRIVSAILDGVRIVESSMLDAVAEVMDDYSQSFGLVAEQRVGKAQRTVPVSIPGSPDGNFLNIGLLEEKTDRQLPISEILSKLPQGVTVIEAKEVQGTEPTVSVQLSRKLTDAEMDKFLADTKQMAIPQLADGEGVIHGTTDWGPFDPKEFKMPDGRPLSDATKGGDSKRMGKLQIIGENAYLSQNVKDNLTVARNMENSGGNPKDIRMATGWERGADGKWRYEIDPAARLNLRLSPPIVELTNGNIADAHEGALEDLIRFDELFRLYPRLRRIPVDLYIGGIDGVQGALSVAKDGTPIYIQMFAKDKSTALSGMIHEIQHAIQQIEGFAIGGDLTTITNERRELTDEEKFDAYKRLAGETEARNAQERAKMSSADRRAKTLQETEDVAREEQIVIFQSGKAQPVESLAAEEQTGIKIDAEKVFGKAQPIGGFEKEMYEDEDKFKRLKQKGFIKFVDNIFDITEEGEPIMVHAPDNMFVGKLSIIDEAKGDDGKTTQVKRLIVEGNGGIYYALKSGNVWASSEAAVNKMVKIINGIVKQNGKAKIILVSGPQSKLISTTTGVKAAMTILEDMMDKGLIPKSAMRKALVSAGKKYNINFSGNDSAKDIKADIKKSFMDPSDSTFEKRGNFFEQLIGELSSLEFAKDKDNNAKIGEFLGAVRQGKKGIKQFTFSKSAILESIGKLMSERILTDVPSGRVYAAIEVDGEVEMVKSSTHEAYGTTIQKKKTKEIIKKEKELNKELEIATEERKEEIKEEIKDLGRPVVTVFNDRQYEAGDVLLTMAGKTQLEAGVSFRGSIGLAQAGLGKAIASRNAIKSSDSPRKAGKAQGDLDAYVADLMNKDIAVPGLKTITYKGKTILIDKKTLEYVKAGMAKPAIMKLLTEEVGMSKKEAEETYKRSKAYLAGNRQGKKTAYDFAKQTIGKWLDLRSREAISLNDELKKLLEEYAVVESQAQTAEKQASDLRMKKWSTDEFIIAALDLVNARMKERGNPPFSKSQIESLFNIISGTTKVSADNVRTNGYAVVEAFIGRLSKIFDAQDAKAEMIAFKKQVETAKKLQSRMSKLASAPKKAVDSIQSFRQAMLEMAKIDPAFIPNVDEFISTAADLIAAASKTKTIKDADTGDIIAVVPNPEGITAYEIQAQVDRYAAVEEVFKDVYRRQTAEKRANSWANEQYTAAKAAGYTGSRADFKASIAQDIADKVTEEYDAILKAEQDRLIPATRKKLMEMVEAHNLANPTDQKSLSNWEDLEYFYERIADQKATEDKLRVEAIIDQAIGDLLENNIETLAKEKEFASIFGDAIQESGPINTLDRATLMARMLTLSKRELLQLEFRMRDFIDNGNKYGLGQLEAALSAKLDGIAQVENLLKDGVKARSSSKLRNSSMFDSIESFHRLLFAGVSRAKMTKIRSILGLSGIVSGYAMADAMHAQNTEEILAKIKEIENGGGDIMSLKSRMIAQIYSMLRQHKQINDISELESKAVWFGQVRRAAERSVADIKKQKRYTDKEIKEFESAFDFLFGGDVSLDDVVSDVKIIRPDVVEFVDFMVDFHNRPNNLGVFSEYVEKFLGQELEVLPNYTPIRVINKTASGTVNAEQSLMDAAMQTVRQSSLNQMKKVAGASYERNDQSLNNDTSLIGLDFLAINESTLRENTVLANTIKPMIYAAKMFNSEAVNNLIPDDALRAEYIKKIIAYTGHHRNETPAILSKDLIIAGKKVTNPMFVLRSIATVKAFGSIFVQTPKQLAVMASVVMNTKDKAGATMYIAQNMIELAIAATKSGLWFGDKDMKIALINDGRYDLLRNSPVFLRDYNSAQINPYNGSIASRETRASKMLEKTSEFSLKNLKGTDKMASISSWFAFYGDYLISSGAVNSFSEIDWKKEASNPNKDAISHADNLVSKDQGASTPREAVGIYATGQGNAFQQITSAVLSATVYPFTRFALNKKRSISYSLVKLAKGNKEAKKEAAAELFGDAIETTYFATVSYIMLPMLMSVISSLFGLEDEEEKEDVRKIQEKRKNWMALSSVVKDLSPMPMFLIPNGDEMMMEGLNKAMYYSHFEDQWSSERREDDAEKGYERWKAAGNGFPIFDKKDEKGILDYVVAVSGPQGQFVQEAVNTASNLAKQGEKVTSLSGKEYYIRPEDQDRVRSMYAVKALLTLGQFAGLSSKEFDMITKKIDDMPVSRRLTGEEEYLTYAAVSEALLNEGYINSDDPRAKAIKEEGLETAGEKLQLIYEHTLEVDAPRAQSIKTAVAKVKKSAVAEYVIERDYPVEFKKYMNELRSIYDAADKSGDSRAFILMNYAEELPAKERDKFLEVAGVYVRLRSEGGAENLQWYMEDIRREREARENE